MRYEVVLDWGETPNKCTIAPLVYRQDFRLIGVPRSGSLKSLRSQLLLHPEGECITQLRDSECTLLAAVDCIWKRLPALLERIEGGLPRLVRIPDGFVTVYPRRVEHSPEPEGGLATIEAIFTAAALLGNWDPTLLSEYYFGRAYVERNAELFVKLGVSEAADSTRWPVMNKKARSSEQRKAGRKVGYPAGVEV